MKECHLLWAEMDSEDSKKARLLFHYDEKNGDLIWRRRHNDLWFNSRFAGKVAGSLTPMGYISVRFLGRAHLAHRVVWLMHHGAWPVGQIDHRDGRKANNRIQNLRDVSPAVNARNKPQRQGRSGVKGVHWSKRQQAWQARAGRTHLGFFATIEEAASVVARSICGPSKTSSRPKRPPPSHASVVSVLRYDADTGLFFFRGADGVERTAGSMSHGYIRIQVCGHRYHAQKLAVFYMTGQWPTGLVDHVNGKKDDNRWSNLRVVSGSANALNRRSRPDRGIRPGRNMCGGWEAAISVAGRRYHLGTFPTKEAAREAWDAAFRQHFERQVSAKVVDHPLFAALNSNP